MFLFHMKKVIEIMSLLAWFNIPLEIIIIIIIKNYMQYTRWII